MRIHGEAESANAMLNRWLRMKQEESRGPIERRPVLAEECHDLATAEHWRKDILKDIAKKATLIQNMALGEHRIRDLNDEINKLIREKRHWEHHIYKLGGPDYLGGKPPGMVKYEYFGAARDLPGVKELLESEAPPPTRRTRGELYKLVDYSYFGYRDEEDTELLAAEAEAERRALAEAMEEYNAQQAAGAGVEYTPTSIDAVLRAIDDDVRQGAEAALSAPPEEETEEDVSAHVPLPTREEFERELVEKRKKMLFDKYVSSSLAAEEQDAKRMLNIS
eukprot:gnl/Trimastix_PCT/1607.p1 GENE.gnl/Trimastix_PCT/1607~~gnl/Trimastix_PCT/1607.p1  ORF type:complete len:278 (+),score=85.89 gnl/Trimastix_PCT/1607:141-974(+)